MAFWNLITGGVRHVIVDPAGTAINAVMWGVDRPFPLPIGHFLFASDTVAIGANYGGSGPGGVLSTSILMPISALNWTDNAAFLNKDGAPASHSAYNPRLARNLDGSLRQDPASNYLMLYTGSDPAEVFPDEDVGWLASSTNLETWTKNATGPVLPKGSAGVDAGDTSPYSFIFDGSGYHLFYEGNGTVPDGVTGDEVDICYATSTDGKVWTKLGEVISSGATGDADDLYAPCVLKDGATWKCWYSGKRADHTTFGVMYATATAPGGPWTKQVTDHLFNSGNPYLCDVWIENGIIHMLYIKLTGGGVVYANSLDGLAWAQRREIFARGALTTQAIANGKRYLFSAEGVYTTGIDFQHSMWPIATPSLSGAAKFTQAQTISIGFSGCPSKTNAWVGVFIAGDVYTAYLDWKWTDNTQAASGAATASGTVTFAAGSLPNGFYEAWLILDGHVLAKRSFGIDS